MKKQRHNYGTMAEALGVTRLTISNWDKGITSPTIIQAVKICNLLEIKIIDLLKNDKKIKENKNEKKV
jgi:DNA-binding XRE family transcriptional regulator